MSKTQRTSFEIRDMMHGGKLIALPALAKEDQRCDELYRSKFDGDNDNN